MTGKRQLTPAEAAFLAEFVACYELCGSPPYRWLVRASGELHRQEGLPSLSNGAISEILNGHRLPTSAWMASFIRCCHKHAFQIGRFTRDPGKDGLPEWQEKLEAARRAAKTPEPRGVETAAAETVSPEVLTFEPPTAGSDEGAMVAGFTLTKAEREYVGAQRSYGRTLLAELDRTGSPEAAYRVAVVLAASPEHHESGASLLMGPATTNHPDALALLDAGPDPAFRTAVGEHASALGAEALADGDLEAAIVFYTCAVRCGSQQSAVELAAIVLTLVGDHVLAEEIRAANRTPPAPVRP
jgi:hypothetical protein